LVLLLILLAVGLRGPGKQPLVIRATGADPVQITLDGEPVKNGVVTEVLPGAHEIAASAPGFLTQHRSVSVVEGEAPPVVELTLRSEHPAPTPPPAPAPPAGTPAVPAPEPQQPAAAVAQVPQPPATFSARFDAEEKGIEVSVEGKAVGRTPEAKLTELEVGKTYHFTAERAGYKARSGTFNSADGSDVVIPVDLDPLPRPKPPPEPRPEPRHVRREAPSAPAAPRRATRSARSRAKGRLAASTHPAGAEIYIDNRPTGRHTPVAPGSPLMVPVGTHKVFFRLGSKKSPVQTVEIDENETTKLINVPLQ
jgi:hypothetical protein